VEDAARQVVDPGIEVSMRLVLMDDVISQLMDMETEPRIVYVKADAAGKGDGASWDDGFDSVQSGIDALGNEGGWVWVSEGVYEERIVLRQGVLLFGGFRGTEDDLGDRNVPWYRTTLMGNSMDPVVFMEHFTMIDGFTITNGGGGETDGGAGIFTGDWLAIVRDNVIRDNRAGWSGGGIFVNGSSEPGDPADIALFSPIIVGNLITRNDSPCGDGICTRHCTAMIAYNTIVNHPLKGIEIVSDVGDAPTIVNSILWNNGDDLYHHIDWPGRAVFQYNCVQDEESWEGVIGVINLDPMLNDTTNGDFTLQAESPCIDAGHPDAPSDPDDTPSDIGAYPFLQHVVDGGVDVILETQPKAGMEIVLDTKTYETPVIPLLLPGSAHTLRALECQNNGPRSRYRFHEWSDGGERVHSVTIPPYPMRYTAVYRVEHQLSIDTGNLGGNPSGEGWFFPGTRVVISVDSTIVDAPGTTRYAFDSWTGIGAGSYSGILRQAVVAVNEPIT
jgi:hypothetical protein